MKINTSLIIYSEVLGIPCPRYWSFVEVFNMVCSIVNGFYYSVRSFSVRDSLPCLVDLETFVWHSTRSSGQKNFWPYTRVVVPSDSLLVHSYPKMGLISSLLSRLRLALSWSELFDSSKCLIYMVRSLILTRITASIPKAKLKGVLLVDVWGVVWYTHNTLGNSTTHLPLASSSLVLST